MVIGPIPFDEIPRKPSENRPAKKDARSLEARLASPIDRVAAFIADLVLLVPLMTLIAAPFRRRALEAQLLENNEGWASAYILAVGACVLFFLAYQTVFLVWWGATPGKRALGLKVETLWENRKKPRAFAAFLRAVGLCLEMLCLGLPWVAVFGNARRRPFHDRLGDTVVVAVRATKAAGPPNMAEISMAAPLLPTVSIM